jgi:hypothetical protein
VADAHDRSQIFQLRIQIAGPQLIPEARTGAIGGMVGLLI